MVNRAGILLLVLLFIPIMIGADTVTSSITCNGASFVVSSVVQPDNVSSRSPGANGS